VRRREFRALDGLPWLKKIRRLMRDPEKALTGDTPRATKRKMASPVPAMTRRARGSPLEQLPSPVGVAFLRPVPAVIIFSPTAAHCLTAG
jgi:hypothetical protein